MTEAEYLRLAEICDGLLREEAGNARVANTWLHVIREHPVFLQNYADLFSPSSDSAGPFLRRQARLAAVHGRQIARSALAGAPWFPAQPASTPTDILFISHALTEGHAETEADFYFGGVPQALADAGYRAHIALINYTRLSSRSLAHRWRHARVPRLVLSRSLSLGDEVAFRRVLQQDRKTLSRRGRAERDTTRGRVLKRAAEESLSSGSLGALRLANQVGALVRAFSPRALVTTYEGHAWERLAYAAARKARPSIVTVGYQHAAVFRLQHAMKRCLSRGFDPDVILTAGIAAQRQLRASPGLEGVRIDVLGSDRSFAQAHAFADVAREVSDKPQGCVVLPESLDTECRKLFEFSMKAARALPDVRFIWRLHPLMTVDGLLSRVPSLRGRPSNCEFSLGTLDEDLSLSRWALYRGTTAIVRAVGAGCQPIYLSEPGEIPIDPLYDLADWRVTVGDVAELVDVVRAAPDLVAAEAAMRHCSTLFVPFNPSPLADLLARVTSLSGA